MQLDSAVQDGTLAIELTETNTAELASRATVYFRLNRLDDALADLNTAVDKNPTTAGSLDLRAAIERKFRKTRTANEDAANAHLITPSIDEEYARWKIKA